MSKMHDCRYPNNVCPHKKHYPGTVCRGELKSRRASKPDTNTNFPYMRSPHLRELSKEGLTKARAGINDALSKMLQKNREAFAGNRRLHIERFLDRNSDPADGNVTPGAVYESILNISTHMPFDNLEGGRQAEDSLQRISEQCIRSLPLHHQQDHTAYAAFRSTNSAYGAMQVIVENLNRNMPSGKLDSARREARTLHDTYNAGEFSYDDVGEVSDSIESFLETCPGIDDSDNPSVQDAASRLRSYKRVLDNTLLHPERFDD